MWGAGFAFRKEICASCAGRVSALVGYRYLHASDDLAILTNKLGLVPGIGFFTGSSADQFSTANDFSGLDLGLTGESRYGAFTFEWIGKVAVGANYSTAQINGVSTFAVAGGPAVTSTGGILALPSNIGNFTRPGSPSCRKWRSSWAIRSHRLRIHAGYDSLFWSNVVRRAT